jgi:hypothetical protein
MHITFEQLARDIIARPAFYAQNSLFPAWQWESEALGYIDNLSEGDDDPDALIEMLAKDEAAEDLPESFPDCDAQGYSWHDGPYSEDQWWAEELPAYVAAVRSTYGMVSA